MKRKNIQSEDEAITAEKAGKIVHDKDEREKFKQRLYRPPTSEELQELKETETLYKDSLFRMQMNCLLDEVKLKESEQTEVDSILHSFHKFMDTLEDWKDTKSLSDLSWIPSTVKFPVSFKEGRILKGNFQFKKPSTIKVIGSFLLKTGARPTPTVDIAVEMPEGCFHPKDYLNYRYHAKRALYLCALASHILSWEEATAVHFTRCRRNTKKPTLQVHCKGPSGKLYVIHVIPSLGENVFQLKRFLPHLNNVRMSWLKGDSVSQDEIGPPTPFYNSTILEDILYEQHLHYLYNAIKVCPGMVDAIILFKVWLHQRGFYEDCCAFNGFVASMVMGYLLSIRKITRHMSSYQIFRVTLQFIATSSWSETGISMVADDTNTNMPSLTEVAAAGKITLVDPSGYLNLCYALSEADYEHLLFEAHQAIQILDRKHSDSFDSLFVKRVTFAEKCDHWFSLPGFKSMPELQKYIDDDHEQPENEDWPSLLINDITALLKKGLGSRVLCVHMKPQTLYKWAVSETPQGSAVDDVLFGFILNPDGYDKIIEKGPAADSPEAPEFRQFWGTKAEMRRFKDGSINIAVVWDVKSHSDRTFVMGQVVKYLLHKKFGISYDKVFYCCNQLNQLLEPRLQLSTQKNTPENGSNFEEQQKVCEVFDELSRQIRKLDGLPLQVNTVQGTSPVLRQTEVFSPRLRLKKKKKHEIVSNTIFGKYEKPNFKAPQQLWTPAIEVSLQFETSGRWPNDLPVVQHLKAAFYLKVADLLKKQCGIQSLVSPTFLDIYKGGFVFRLRIFHFREVNLLKELETAGAEKKELVERAKELDRTMIKLPLHATMINGLGHQFPGFRNTVRLAKRWVSAHLLCKYLSEEAIELIASSVFLKMSQYIPPVSYQSGFLRFLNLLSNYDWKNTPLILDLNASLKEKDYEEITEHFQRNRAALPSIFIATPYDKTESIWTTPQPDFQILSRLKFLATECYKTLTSQLMSQTSVNMKKSFRPYLGDFDVIISLDRDHVPRHYQAVDTAFLVRPPVLHGVISDTIPVTTFDPVALYMEDLQNSFSEFAQFYHDVYGGTTIGVIWKTKNFTAQALKVFHSHYRTKVSKTNDSSTALTVPDMTSIVSDFKLLGKGLVKEVTLIRTV